MRPILVLEEAAVDIEQARVFYNLQQSGIGEDFAQSILSDLESLAIYHGIHTIHFGFHRMLCHRFPFGIYYREFSKFTEVFGILDLRRNPAWIRNELGDRNSRQ